MNRCSSDWPDDLNDVTKSHPIADESVVALGTTDADAEVKVVDDGTTPRQRTGIGK